MLLYPRPDILNRLPNAVEQSSYCKLAVFKRSIIPPADQAAPRLSQEALYKFKKRAHSLSGGGRHGFRNFGPLYVDQEVSYLLPQLKPINVLDCFGHRIEKPCYHIAYRSGQLRHIQLRNKAPQRFQRDFELSPQQPSKFAPVGFRYNPVDTFRKPLCTAGETSASLIVPPSRLNAPPMAFDSVKTTFSLFARDSTCFAAGANPFFFFFSALPVFGPPGAP